MAGGDKNDERARGNVFSGIDLKEIENSAVSFGGKATVEKHYNTKIPWVIVAAIIFIAIVLGIAFLREPITLALKEVIPPFPAAGDDEILIVVATFFRTEGIADADIHGEIRSAIEEQAQQMGFNNVRVEIDPTRLAGDDQDEARKLGNRYKANVIVWGADTGVRITVNILNLKESDLSSANVEIDETEKSLIANPNDYVQFVTGDLPSKTTILAFFAVGQAFTSQRNYLEAERIFREILKIQNADFPEAKEDIYFQLGWLNQNLGNIDQAIIDYSYAIEIDPEDAYPYNNRGNAYYALGNLREALADYNTAIEIYPEYPIAYNNRGIVRYAQGDLEGAIADYTRAVELDPELADAYYNRGVVHKDQEEFDEAIADFNRTIEIEPAPDAYLNRGFSRYALRDLEGAIADYTEAIEIDPDFALAYHRRADALYNRGDFEGAKADYTRTIELAPENANAHISRGNCHLHQGYLEKAIADYDQAIEINPDSSLAYYNRGIAHDDLGNFEEAIADYTRAIEINPEYASAYYNRGLVHRNLSEIELAIEDFRQFLSLEESSEFTIEAEKMIAEMEAQITGH